MTTFSKTSEFLFPSPWPLFGIEPKFYRSFAVEYLFCKKNSIGVDRTDYGTVLSSIHLDSDHRRLRLRFRDWKGPRSMVAQ
jgi:hypothetical protein